MRWMRSITALGAFFVIGIGLSACGGGVGGNTVASVAGNAVSLQAFNHWMYVAAKGQAAQSPGAPVIVPNDPPNFTGCVKQVRAQIPTLSKEPDSTIKADCKQLFTSLSSQVMDFLIRAYWYQAEAYKQHINVTQAQLNKAFQSAKQQQFPTSAQFQAFLAQSGQTLSDLMFRVRVNQLYQKLLAKYPTKVTPAQIQSYYTSHTSQFGSPETRDIRIVRTNSPAQAQAAKSALQHGQGWPAVTKKYSVDTATKDNGGLLSGVTKGEEEQALDKAAFSAPANKLQGPIHGQFGYYVFEVTKIKSGSQQSLAKATPLIRQILTSQLQSKAQTAVDNQAKKDWLSKTDCATSYMMADCKGFKASSSSSSSSSSSGAATPPASTTPPTTPPASSPPTTPPASSPPTTPPASSPPATTTKKK